MLGLFPRTRWPAVDSSHEQEVRRDVDAALLQGQPPEPRTGALIALLHAVDQAHKVIPHEGMSNGEVKKRAKAIAEGDWAAKGVTDAIAAANAAVTAAIAASAATTAATSSSQPGGRGGRATTVSRPPSDDLAEVELAVCGSASARRSTGTPTARPRRPRPCRPPRRAAILVSTGPKNAWPSMAMVGVPTS